MGKTSSILLLFLCLVLGCSHSISRNVSSIPSDYELPPGVQGILNAEQLLLSREVDENEIKSPNENPQADFYKPENQNVYEVKTYWINESDLNAFKSSSLDSKLKKIMKRTSNGVTQWRLIVHPESENFYEEVTKKGIRAEDFLATSTASSRTLVVWPKDKPELVFFGKLSLDVEIAGSVRTIPGNEVARSIGTTELLDSAAPHLPRSFKYLPETIGIIPRGQHRGGMIIRQIPEDIKSAIKKYVPLFSLYAKCKSCDKAPLLVDMINESKLPPDIFVREKIISPFLDQWIEIVSEEGLSVEAHAQNVFLGVGNDRMPNGEFLHRDFGGFHIDFEYRKSLGLPIPKNLPIINSLANDYHRRTHHAALASSLHTYFTGGFVYNLDQHIPKWVSEGLIPGYAKKDQKKYFVNMVYELLAKKLGAKSLNDIKDPQKFAWHLKQLRKNSSQIKMGSVGIYTGSFDPPTLSHKKVMTLALDNYSIEKLHVFINVSGPKDFKTSYEERKAMILGMLGPEYADKVVIAPILQENKDGVIDELAPNKLKIQFVGQDSFDKVPASIKLASDIRWAVIPRGEEEIKIPRSVKADILPRFPETSSTEVRKLILEGKIKEAKIDPFVANYITKNKLYIPLLGQKETLKIQVFEKLFANYLNALKRIFPGMDTSTIVRPNYLPTQSKLAWYDKFTNAIITQNELHGEEAEDFRSFSMQIFNELEKDEVLGKGRIQKLKNLNPCDPSQFVMIFAN